MATQQQPPPWCLLKPPLTNEERLYFILWEYEDIIQMSNRGIKISARLRCEQLYFVFVLLRTGLDLLAAAGRGCLAWLRPGGAWRSPEEQCEYAPECATLRHSRAAAPVAYAQGARDAEGRTKGKGRDAPDRGEKFFPYSPGVSTRREYIVVMRLLSFTLVRSVGVIMGHTG